MIAKKMNKMRYDDSSAQKVIRDDETKGLSVAKVLKFMAMCILLLTIVSIIFPKEGIAIGEQRLRFAKPSKVLTAHHRESVETPKPRLTVAEREALTDSLDICRSMVLEGSSRLWLPNDDERFFDSFFARAEDASQNGSTLRVLYYGDSQIEMDRITCCVRDRQQSLFGGGGVGMLQLNQQVASLTVTQTASGRMTGLSAYGGKPMQRSDGNYGPMLRCWHIDGAATASFKATHNKAASNRVKHFGKLRMLFNNRPGPLAVEMVDNYGNRFSRSVSAPGVQQLEWILDSAATTIDVRLNGNADIYGVVLDYGCGVALDNVAMRGVSGTQFRMVDSLQLSTSYDLLNVGLIVLQFGGNVVPYLKNEAAIEHYCSRLVEQFGYLRSVCPGVKFLFVGPSDMSTRIDGEFVTYPLLPKLVERLRTTALSNGVAYWSLYDAMGGSGSMVEWVRNGNASKDYVHYSVKGSMIMGDMLGDAFENMYKLYSLKRRGV